MKCTVDEIAAVVTSGLVSAVSAAYGRPAYREQPLKLEANPFHA
jgi:hypothetical protein